MAITTGYVEAISYERSLKPMDLSIRTSDGEQSRSPAEGIWEKLPAHTSHFSTILVGANDYKGTLKEMEGI
jgi:hypothetical protein